AGVGEAYGGAQGTADRVGSVAHDGRGRRDRRADGAAGTVVDGTSGSGRDAANALRARIWRMRVRRAWATCVAPTGTASTDVPWSWAAKACASGGGPVTSTRVPARNDRRASRVSITDPTATPLNEAQR